LIRFIDGAIEHNPKCMGVLSVIKQRVTMLEE